MHLSSRGFFKMLKYLMSCLKGKLEMVTGASCSSMIVEVYDKDNKFLCRLDNNDALIGSYPIDDGARLHVICHL